MIETAPLYGEGYRKVWACVRLPAVRAAARGVRPITTNMAHAVLAIAAWAHVPATVDHCNSECVGQHAASGAKR